MRGPPGLTAGVLADLEEQYQQRWRRERERRRKRRKRWLADIRQALIENGMMGVRATQRMAERTLTELVVDLVAPNLYGTLTFPSYFPEGIRRTRCRTFLQRWFRGGIWALAFERHKSGLTHAHFVARDSLRRLTMMDSWNEETGGYARVYSVPMQDQPKVAAYVAKYITKEQGDELEFGPGVHKAGAENQALDRLRPEGS